MKLSPEHILHLSPKEKAIFVTLMRLKYAKKVSVIAAQANIPRTTTIYTLKKLEKRKLVIRVISPDFHKCPYWRYNKAVNRIESRFR